MRMTAISLWQPWAALPFCVGRFGQLKKDETRHWAYPSRLNNQTVLIHASKTKAEVDKAPCDCSWCEAVCAAFGEYHFGAFLGTVRLTGCFRTVDCTPDEDNEAAGDWSPGRYAWRMEEPRKFAAPIPAIGRQGFWTVDIEI